MRRPVTITAIGWLFIVVGAAGLVNDLWPLLTPDAAHQLAKLKADGLRDLGPAWTSRLLAIVGGVGLLRGHNWARWLLVAWMVFHIGLSLVHSLPELLMHTVIFIPILLPVVHAFVGALRSQRRPRKQFVSLRTHEEPFRTWCSPSASARGSGAAESDAASASGRAPTSRSVVVTRWTTDTSSWIRSSQWLSLT